VSGLVLAGLLVCSRWRRAVRACNRISGISARQGSYRTGAGPVRHGQGTTRFSPAGPVRNGQHGFGLIGAVGSAGLAPEHDGSTRHKSRPAPRRQGATQSSPACPERAARFGLIGAVSPAGLAPEHDLFDPAQVPVQHRSASHDQVQPSRARLERAARFGLIGAVDPGAIQPDRSRPARVSPPESTQAKSAWRSQSGRACPAGPCSVRPADPPGSNRQNPSAIVGFCAARSARRFGVAWRFLPSCPTHPGLGSALLLVSGSAVAAPGLVSRVTVALSSLGRGPVGRLV
jgi:hypothetical protein